VARTLAPPERVTPVLERLWSEGHAAYLVGGVVRDLLRGRDPAPSDIPDIATDARPERILELFPEGRYENRFGTVALPGLAEITTFRRDHRYGDHRRPESVTFTDRLEDDLLRRDFTVNAIAWGGPGRPTTEAGSLIRGLVDPTGGLEDLAAGRLRAVGDAEARFDEDALRLLRAARLAAQLGFEIEPSTREAMRRKAPVVGHVSRERVGQELRRLFHADRPSVGLRVMADTGLLEAILPELAAQRGIPQNKPAGEDLWDHTLATVDALADLASEEREKRSPGYDQLVLAALLHDVGKPATLVEAFRGHDEVGAAMAGGVLERLAVARRDAERVVRLVRQHMFIYRPEWSDAAVRRFLRKVGPDLFDELILLRRADNRGSGIAVEAGGVDELARRAHDQLAAGVPLTTRQLAVDGDDLQAALGMPPGPEIGRLLERLLDSVIADPERNVRERLLADARTWTRR
jgi:tRNA nucleotidyltransferase (CCA-adding enzyme)